ncbi:CDP-glucose 4,6-dehydratase [Vibrio spartinae]|uniref:CDP-glucose 4,6-dehydratase n=1 Tax=Vibrio spartinae TaxID=1918945 RepID=A0ABX6QVE3_9VIBR|nr:CDP-glucose 4,6-dehydratase [Vibrio spartinae]QMV12972.1 CDP-glucose 4,6-dehydratase [Vibrio spartinae]
MEPSFWKSKRVLITGNTGFKGSWLSLWLHDLGANVRGYSLSAPTSPSLFQEARIGDNIPTNLCDIRDFDNIYRTIKEFRPEIIFHLAAQPLVRLSYTQPVETYSTNVMGTVHLFEAVRQVGGVKAVINITSDKCYENREWIWGYREDESLGGHDPYSNSKGCAELVTSSYRNSFFSPERYAEHGCAIASVRAGNVIGGGDWAQDRLIPDILNAFAEKSEVSIRNPNATRPWQHVLEPLSGYIRLAEFLYEKGSDFAEAWNFGPKDNDARPVKFLIERLAELWEDDVRWCIHEDAQYHEAHYLKLDCSKAKSRLGWQPIWDLDTTLEKIIQWHKAWLNHKDMKQYTLNEIREYVAAIKKVR